MRKLPAIFDKNSTIPREREDQPFGKVNAEALISTGLLSPEVSLLLLLWQESFNGKKSVKASTSEAAARCGYCRQAMSSAYKKLKDLGYISWEDKGFGPGRVRIVTFERSINAISDAELWKMEERLVSSGKKVEDDSPEEELPSVSEDTLEPDGITTFLVDGKTFTL